MSEPIRYAIRQVSSYAYASEVPYARHTVRLAPTSRLGIAVEEASIDIDPAPDESTERQDFFDNLVLDIALEHPHRTLDITCTAAVTVAPALPVDPAGTPAWETIRSDAALSTDLGPQSPAHFVFPSRLVPIVPAICTWTAASFPPTRPVLAGAIDLMKRIKADFAYDPTATDVTTAPADAFALRRGVCQDFAHVMIAGFRSLGLPAAYVSGYLRTVPPPGKPRLEGADAMHAWVSVWCGAKSGWVGLDPTNALVAGADHIPIAIGRDYADVSPIDGVIIAAGGHTLRVAVDVIAVDDRTTSQPASKSKTIPS